MNPSNNILIPNINLRSPKQFFFHVMIDRNIQKKILLQEEKNRYIIAINKTIKDEIIAGWYSF